MGMRRSIEKAFKRLLAPRSAQERDLVKKRCGLSVSIPPTAFLIAVVRAKCKVMIEIS